MKGVRDFFDKQECIKVAAFDFDTKVEVGKFVSLSDAARKLFIRGDGASKIYSYLLRGKINSTRKRGVISKKTGLKYHFEVIK